MNWIGGSHARAKAQEQFNKFRRNAQRTIRQNVIHLDDEDSIDTDSNNEGGQGPGDNASVAQGNSWHGREPSRRRHKRSRADPVNEWEKDVNYEELGFVEVIKNPVRRRVVPLLEYVEKTFPKFGHILSLQLSHQMDITKTPDSELAVSVSAYTDTSVTSTDDDSVETSVTNVDVDLVETSVTSVDVNLAETSVTSVEVDSVETSVTSVDDDSEEQSQGATSISSPLPVSSRTSS